MARLFLLMALFAGSVFLSVNVHAGNIQGFTCWPTVRDVRLVVYQKGPDLKFKVSSPMGYAMLPQIEGPISQFLIPSAQMQARELQTLSDEFEVSWPFEKCSRFEPENNQISCDGIGTVGSTGVESTLLRSYKLTEEGDDATNISYKFRLALLKDGNTYFVTLVFPQGTCKTF